jgi:signal transduction histidine kinase
MSLEINPKEIIQKAFPGIQESIAEDMVQNGKIRTYPPDVILCLEGAIESTFYIILSGEVKVTKLINDSEVRSLKQLVPGNFFGEMAIIHDAPRAATVTTTTETSVLEIYKNDFARLLEHSSSISMAMVREVSRRLRQNDDMAIDDLRQKARELSTAYQQLAEVEFARREFLTTIAHELRTPLMTANGFLQVIRMGMLQGEALNSAINTISNNIQEIITLTNDILFLQEMDLILPEFKLCDVGAIATSAVEQLRTRAEKNKVSLRSNISSGLPPTKADSKSLERAFQAVLDNAIKFSPDGGEVLVEVGFARQQIWIKFIDHGVGIPAHALPRIFDRFFHMDEVNGYLFRGVGLGLSIARQVIEQHHGTISVDSRLGEGSTFTIQLNR